jgi:hypothetical protein
MDLFKSTSDAIKDLTKTYQTNEPALLQLKEDRGYTFIKNIKKERVDPNKYRFVEISDNGIQNISSTQNPPDLIAIPAPQVNFGRRASNHIKEHAILPVNDPNPKHVPWV